MNKSDLRQIIKEEIIKEAIEKKTIGYVIAADEGYIDRELGASYGSFTHSLLKAKVWAKETLAQRNINNNVDYWAKQNVGNNHRVQKIEIRLVK